MLTSLRNRRDHYAGGLLVFIGVATAVQSVQYGLGTMAAVGPGTFPLAMGCILVFCGLLIALGPDAGLPEDGQAALTLQDWRGCGCIALGVASFIILARSAGLLPATFACVFVAALGDRSMTLKQATVLAAAVTLFGLLLFHYGLRINLPLLALGL